MTLSWRSAIPLALPMLGACIHPHHTENENRSAPADAIVVNAKVWSPPPATPADAFAIRDGCFVAVGPRAKIERLRGPATHVIDAQGRRVLPGLIDSHVHLVDGGLSLARLQLRDVPNRAEFLAAVAARARDLPPGQWLLGRGWSTESWPDPSQPDRAWIDPLTPDRPVLLERMDGHSALANSEALRRAGIDERGPPDPPGGRIERDPATRRPTGILRDAAVDLVARLMPPPDDAQRDAAARAAMAEANRSGLTTVNTMSAWSDVDVLRRVHAQRRDTLRVGVFVQEKSWPDFADRVRVFPIDDDRLWIAGFKGYMDGSLGSRTAYMRAPFSDRPDTRGLLMDSALSPERLAANFDAADELGLQSAVHAIGDEANHLLLNEYAALAARRGPRDRRPRVEHVQHLLPDDIPRFAALGVVASMQPFHKADDARYAEAAIGEERCKTSYAFAALLRAGAVLAFGSDWPVVTINPMAGVHAAVTGRTLDGKTWMTHQNLTVEQALTAYTAGAAFACRREARLGRIAPGYLADFVIFESDPFGVAPEALPNVRVAETYLGGRRVWPP